MDHFHRKSLRNQWSWPFELFHWIFLHDFTLFVVDIHQIRLISLFRHLSDHFHFHPTLEQKRVIDLRPCRIKLSYKCFEKNRAKWDMFKDVGGTRYFFISEIHLKYEMSDETAEWVLICYPRWHLISESNIIYTRPSDISCSCLQSHMFQSKYWIY